MQDYSISISQKKLKGDKISEDRRVITDNEILGMTEWYLRKELEKAKEIDPNASNTIEIANDAGKPIFQITLLDNNQ